MTVKGDQIDRGSGIMMEQKVSRREEKMSEESDKA